MTLAQEQQERFEKFLVNLKKRANEDRENGWMTKAEINAIKAETGIDITNDYTRLHWDTYEERRDVVAFGTLEELDDLMYSNYVHSDPDWSDES